MHSGRVPTSSLYKWNSQNNFYCSLAEELVNTFDDGRRLGNNNIDSYANKLSRQLVTTITFSKGRSTTYYQRRCTICIKTKSKVVCLQRNEQQNKYVYICLMFTDRWCHQEHENNHKL